MNTTFLQNNWVIGIATGIISSVLYTLVSKFFISRKKKKEYQQNLSLANAEAVLALRATIAENVVPTLDVVEAVINSCGRKYHVDTSDLFGVEILCEELVKDVMDSSYITAKAKQKYCDALVELKLSHSSKRRHQHHNSGDKGTVLEIVSPLTVAIIAGISAVTALSEKGGQDLNVEATKLLVLISVPAVFAVLSYFFWSIKRKDNYYYDDLIDQKFKENLLVVRRFKNKKWRSLR